MKYKQKKYVLRIIRGQSKTDIIAIKLQGGLKIEITEQ